MTDPQIETNRTALDLINKEIIRHSEEITRLSEAKRAIEHDIKLREAKKCLVDKSRKH